MKIQLPLNKDKLPFLDKQGVQYEITKECGESDQPVMQKMNHLLCTIELEATTANIMDLSFAMIAYGRQEGIKAAVHLIN